MVAKAAKTGDTALEVRGLKLFYGSFAALKGIDLAVGRGEFVALLGPSGCGKTSLLRSIAGFNHPGQGEIRLNGSNVLGIPTRKRNIGFLFQSYALFPDMSVQDNVRFGLDCRAVPRAEADRRVDEALARVGLDHLSGRFPRALSGGQQQRVALARAIVVEPDILLLDEPLSALDKQLRQRMQTELKELQKSLGITALFVTHDQEEAMTMADRIVVMRDGELRQVAPPEELFSNPCDAWVCDFVNAGNLVRGTMKAGAKGVIETTIDGHSRFQAAAHPDLPADETVLYVPYHAMKAEKVSGGDGLKVAAVRYLGLAAELQVIHGEDLLRVQIPIDKARDFPNGCRVRLSADRRNCRMLPLDARSLAKHAAGAGNS